MFLTDSRRCSAASAHVSAGRANIIGGIVVLVAVGLGINSLLSAFGVIG